MSLYAGTSGYSYKPWKGKFYPKKLADDRMLAFYSEHFRAVEINQSFYRMPTLSDVKGWAKEVSGEFRFALKAPQQITHRLRLRNADKPVAQFLAVAGQLGKRLGPLLFQLPPNFKKDLPRLQAFLKLLPRRRRIAFEFRHASWFDEEVLVCCGSIRSPCALPMTRTNWRFRLRRRRIGAICACDGRITAAGNWPNG
jgi:uncharacterized protein YecE (DUF72 family)